VNQTGGLSVMEEFWRNNNKFRRDKIGFWNNETGLRRDKKGFRRNVKGCRIN
jgi:hypothetical protein